MELRKILFYGQGNARDHVNHYEMSKTQGIEVYSIIQKHNALMEKSKNVYVIKEIDEAIKFACKYKPDLVIISNRADLSKGVTEKFEENGFKVFGIHKETARLEICKEYAKQFMIRNNILTPYYFVSTNINEAIQYIEENWNKTNNGFVLKVDQFSKNSFERTAVPSSLEDAKECAYRMYNTIPNAKILIEEKIQGYELSLHILINNGKYVILPRVQDYKKKYSNNEGPMTAGTASVSDTTEYSEELLLKIKKNIIEPTINGFIKENIEYNYILYIGLMIDGYGEPYVLEYNTRSGNPEWLAILGNLDKNLYDIFKAFYKDIESIQEFWKKDSISIAIGGFSSGYPETERNNYFETIKGLEDLSEGTEVFGEHIVSRENMLYPSGGRVFILRRTGNNFNKIKEEIISDFYKIEMNGLYFRPDIKQIDN